MYLKQFEAAEVANRCNDWNKATVLMYYLKMHF